MKSPGRVRKRKGSVMIEFTLGLSFLIGLFLGLWEFGFCFYKYAELENAVRAGARYASLRKYDSATPIPTAAFLRAVQLMTVYGDPAADPATATPVLPGLKPEHVQVTVKFLLNAPEEVTVSINNFKLPTYIGNVTLKGKPYVWFPHMGIFGPP